MQIEGLKLIYKTGGIDLSDDPSYPWKLEAFFRPSEFMRVAHITLYGGDERIVVRGRTREALLQFVELNGLNIHPRLRRLSVSGPDVESKSAT